MTSSLLLARIWPRIACTLLAAIGASCSMNLRPQPELGGQTVQLAGQWRLESPARDVLVRNLRAVMEQARVKEEERERRRYPYSIPPDEPSIESGSAAPSPSPGDGMQAGPRLRRNNWEMREQREHQDALLNAVLPSNTLQIVQASGRVEMLPESGGWRRFNVGVNSTRVTSYATFRIESGWQKNVFVVHSRDAARNINIVERYQRTGGRSLHMQVELSMPDVKDQIFNADYVLATP